MMIEGRNKERCGASRTRGCGATGSPGESPQAVSRAANATGFGKQELGDQSRAWHEGVPRRRNSPNRRAESGELEGVTLCRSYCRERNSW